MFTRIQDVAPGAIQSYSAKSALFTTASADRGTLFDCTGSFTITLGTTGLSAGWSCWFRNISGTQTLDPSGAVTINGAATYDLTNAGDDVLVMFDGTNFIVSHHQRPSTVAITGGTINGTTVGATTAATGRFTTIESTVSTGTAPLIVASTTAVANLNASLLLGSTWAAPGAIGSGTPNTGAFSSITFGQSLLSQYEEGTWTPTIIGSSTAGTQTYSVQVGRYTRIGNKVTCEFKVQISAKDGTMAGNVKIGGLPFTIKNVTNYNPPMGAGIYQGITFSAGRTQLVGYGDTNTTTIGLYSCGTAVNASAIGVASITDTTVVYGTIVYEI